MLGVLIPTISFGTGLFNENLATFKLPCLKCAKNPVFALLLPWLSFLYMIPNGLAGVGVDSDM